MTADLTKSVRRPPFAAVKDELKLRVPLYLDDWFGGFRDKKVLAATVFIFFASITPAITFGFLLDDRTNHQVGQALTIVGVTGPISIFTITVYAVAQTFNIPFLPFLSVTTLWAAAMHVALAMANACELVKFVTRFACEVFGCLIALVYLYSGIREIVRAFQENTMEVGLISLVFAITTCWVGLQLADARRWHVLYRWTKAFIADYAIPISVIAATVISVVINRFRNSDLDRLVVPSDKPFLTTTNGRPWLPDFGSLPVWAYFAAIIPAAILTILIFFDHNVSSLLAQRPDHNLTKPPSYNYDFLIVGLSMIPCALLGLPVSHGLIPQAPLHVRALAKIRRVPSPDGSGQIIEVWEKVCEQRVSSLGQSALMLIALVPAVLNLVGEIPRAVLAGLFLYMGLASFRGNQFVQRVVLLFVPDKANQHLVFPLSRHISLKSCHKLTIVQIVALAATFGVTESDNAVALTFPLFIAALIPIRIWFLPWLCGKRELELLDADDGVTLSEDGAGTESLDESTAGEQDVVVVAGEMGHAAYDGIGAGGGFHGVDEIRMEEGSRARKGEDKRVGGGTPQSVSVTGGVPPCSILPLLLNCVESQIGESGVLTTGHVVQPDEDEVDVAVVYPANADMKRFREGLRQRMSSLQTENKEIETKLAVCTSEKVLGKWSTRYLEHWPLLEVSCSGVVEPLELPTVRDVQKWERSMGSTKGRLHSVGIVMDAQTYRNDPENDSFQCVRKMRRESDISAERQLLFYRRGVESFIQPGDCGSVAITDEVRDGQMVGSSV
ncbi:Boron transporter 1 [Rhizophlyctis rosea]|uniref:Boron transporter 1 n=1 Tax=Rhizophlyctis rosea TaxID=64517 RepID=A0AAD5SJ32_9FUNG|nr:Boron transporter 1 [Rhizophlyctis rosea]